MVVRPSVSRSRVETERVGASMPPRFVRPNYVNSRCTCLGTEADLTAALRKSLAAGVAVDSPLATIVTAFVVIFSEKEITEKECRKEQTSSPPTHAAVTHSTEFFLLSRLVQICPRPFRGGGTWDAGTLGDNAMSEGAGNRTTARRRTERPFASVRGRGRFALTTAK